MEILVEKLGLRESPRPLLSFRGHSVCHDTDEASIFSSKDEPGEAGEH